MRGTLLASLILGNAVNETLLEALALEHPCSYPSLTLVP